MNYIAYFNGIKLDLRDLKIPQNKQVNTIGRLDTRQTNFTQKFTLDATPTNLQAFDFIGTVGNTSRKPYEKNEFDLIDAESGLHLIYKGFAKITQVTDKGVELNVEDGIVDFYRRIENKTLSDLDLSELTHIKNVPNVYATFAPNNTLPYKYIFADYNGKMLTDQGAGTSLWQINSDYLVPSVLISYLWQKIHDFTGYTFNGSVFNTEKFTNLWMTYPKPVPTTSPVVTFLQVQDAFFTPVSSAFDPNGNFNDNIPFFKYILFPTIFTIPQIQNLGNNNLKILIPGAYRFTSVGNLPPQTYFVYDLNGVQLSTGTINSSVTGVQTIINCNVPCIIQLGLFEYYGVFQSNFTATTTLELIDGYTVNFSEAFIDFKISDFYNQILQLFFLSPLKDNFSNNFEYKKIYERIDTATAVDWSDKFDKELSERFVYENYAKQNNFKYRYDKEEQTHNNGYFNIDNYNLKAEITVVQSVFYSPELNFENSPFQPVKRYKFWEKEVKEILNSTATTIDYREIKNRFYLHRFTQISVNDYLGSQLLSQSQAITTIPISNFDRLNMQEIIFDNYKEIGQILNNAKILDLQFYLTAQDYINFDFKKLIYVRQLQKYFLVNKISNFVKGIKTKVECIALATADIVAQPPITIFYYIVISSKNIVGCDVDLNLTTNLPIGTAVKVKVFTPTFFNVFTGQFDYVILATPEINAITTATGVTFNTSTIQPTPFQTYKFQIEYAININQSVISNLSEPILIPDTCYIP